MARISCAKPLIRFRDRYIPPWKEISRLRTQLIQSDERVAWMERYLADREHDRAAGRTTGYMCKTDYDHELGEAMGGVRIYPSVRDLKANRSCVETCGIVEVEVKFSRLVQKDNWESVE